MSDPLPARIGREASMDEVAGELRQAVEALQPAGVGAHHVTCSDESEYECVNALQRGFTDALLPALKFGEKTAFRTATLGARYEAGSAKLAEDHFATPETARGFKVVLVKINSHVARDAKLNYGRLPRYQVESTYCGALRALLDGGRLPAIDDLRTTFGADGVDRVARLKDAVDEPLWPLVAAIVNAGLQARKAAAEAASMTTATPTLFLVVPCVSINQAGRDTELVCGIHRVDRRSGVDEAYEGLGVDPTAIGIAHERGKIHASIQTG